MMRSLWSGVSGLQAHQIAMDVEGNNIANVNTIGFKYSRANFSDMLSQTSKIATAPQDSSGGKNPQQVGLGTQVNSITRMFSQGSVQTTGKNTDLAIQGNGFFVLSDDGGRTYKYSRNGDFSFDADGNFVNNAGLIAQGWTRDPKTGKIDNTAPIGDIVIPPGLTTPANPTSTLALKANLNSGDHIKIKSPIRELDSTDGLAGGKDPEEVDDFNVLFDSEGDSFHMKKGQGVEISFNGGNDTKKFVYEPVSTLTDLNDGDGDGVYKFRTTEDLRASLQHFMRATASPTATVVVNEKGKYEIANRTNAAGGGSDLNIMVGGIDDANTDENKKFSTVMKSFSGQLSAGSSGIKISQTITAATNSASIDVFDSLGTKHTVRIDYRKQGYVYDANGTKTGASWDMKVSVPEPGDIGGFTKPNQVEGQIVFNSDGSLASYTPASITYTANNGSAPNQTIQLDFGSANKFDGITSFDRESANSGRNQDGFAGGDLDGIRIDASGTLVGSFTNGRSFGLAQISMAKFTNDIGLESDGGDVFIQTANSGDPVIGQAAMGGRGFIQSSSLEMSNVDLSRSLTQLIVVQRGFQANSKTITTSDQMLNTLLQLKQ